MFKESPSGHYWTLMPHLKGRVFPIPLPHDETWDIIQHTPKFGDIRLSGWLYAKPMQDTLVVVLHGLGGTADSIYIRRMARVAARAGYAYLRLNMRGADRSGEDYYHAGLTDDLRATLQSPQLRRFKRIFLVGYSLGGHVMLRWASEEGRDPRVVGMSAISAPLDLAMGAQDFQRPFGRIYQHHVLIGLKATYEALCLRGRPVPIPFSRAKRITNIMEWDDLIVCPRHGFESHQQYYASQSAGPVLHRIPIPVLFVATENDPMVLSHQIKHWLKEAPSNLTQVWIDGGHVGFPHISLMGGQPDPLEPQVLRWLAQQPRRVPYAEMHPPSKEAALHESAHT